jgi:hypothetical protein
MRYPNEYTIPIRSELTPICLWLRAGAISQICQVKNVRKNDTPVIQIAIAITREIALENGRLLYRPNKVKIGPI